MFDSPSRFSESALLEHVQRQTFRYFWDFAHPVSGLSRERNDPASLDVVTTGGSGFGAMAIIIAAERGWVSRSEALAHLLKMTRFLEAADSYHGIYAHWLNGATGRTHPFSSRDDGADLVETSFLFAGLLCARQYFSGSGVEKELRARIDGLWSRADWTWHLRDGSDVLYWHWSPQHGWAMNHPIRGWNECLITYLLAASSPVHAIGPQAYHNGFANDPGHRNGRSFNGIELPLGPDLGGPLFFSHYSFLGLDPRGLRDRYADYWRQNVGHARLNRQHCVQNPHSFKGYGARCWGLTASDNHHGYSAHAPDNDLGVITPTAALSSLPYSPDHSLEALHHFYFERGDQLWGEFGFVDAFSDQHAWTAKSHLAIDQGPIIIMIENYRSGLIWDLFMSCPEIRAGLRALDFQSSRYQDGDWEWLQSDIHGGNQPSSIRSIPAPSRTPMATASATSKASPNASAISHGWA